ncbi:hypothetical protein [Mesorhizobium sp. M0676]|uniref:hypothetical protein n=1 Tax=Mesorhizobium sp. M0676 TaxID=2956984 RepID=UPI003338EF39
MQDRSSRPRRLRRPTPSGGYRDDRTAAPPALDGQADRRRKPASRRRPSVVFCAGWV